MKSFLFKRPQSSSWYFRRVLPKDVSAAIGTREWQISLKTSDERIATARAQKLAGASSEMFDHLQKHTKNPVALEELATSYKQRLQTMVTDFQPLAPASATALAAQVVVPSTEGTSKSGFEELELRTAIKKLLPPAKAAELEARLHNASLTPPQQTLDSTTTDALCENYKIAYMSVLEESMKTTVREICKSRSVDKSEALKAYRAEEERALENDRADLLLEDIESLEDGCFAEVEAFWMANNIVLDPSANDCNHHFKIKFVQAQLEARRQHIEKIAGHKTSIKTAPTLTPVLPSEGWTKAIEYWKSRQSNPKTIAEFESAFERFRKFCKNKALELLRQVDFLSYRNHLQTERALTDKDADQAFHQQMGRIRPILTGYAKRRHPELNELTTALTGAAYATPRPKIEFPKRALSSGELKSWLTCPVYTDFLWDKKGGLEAMYWLPILGMFTGARLEELGQLSLDDFEKIEHHYFMSITHYPARGKRTKSGTNRRVPLHPLLAEFGFTKYIERRKQVAAAPDSTLFPHLRQPTKTEISDGKWPNRTKHFSTVFNELLDKHVIDARGYDFHSFRNNFVEQMDRNFKNTEVRDLLVGHSDDSTASRYGLKENQRKIYPDETLIEAIQSFGYAGVDFSTLLKNTTLWEETFVLNEAGLEFVSNNRRHLPKGLTASLAPRAHEL